MTIRTATQNWMDLEECRSTLLLIWMIGGGIIFVVLIVQSILGRYGSNLQAVWSWFIPTVVPTTSLMLGVLGAGALSGRSIKPQEVRAFFFQISRALSMFYLVALALTIALEPFSPVPAIDLYTMSNYWLGPIQGLVVAAIGVLFVSKQDRQKQTQTVADKNER
jgi:hypothetical protein